MTPAMKAVKDTPLWAMIELFEAELDYQNLSGNTIRIYVGAACELADYLIKTRKITDWREVTPADIKAFIVAAKRGKLPRQRGPASDGYQSNLYRSIQQFFRWWTPEAKKNEPKPKKRDKIVNPMEDEEINAPVLPKPTTPVVRQDQLDALLARTEGPEFVNRRDRAILYVLIDTGLRRAELAGLTVADVDLTNHQIKVRAENAKNRVAREVGFGSDTRLALMRYINLARAAHPRRDDYEQLWLGDRGKGPLIESGVYQMIRKRGRAIDIDPLYPHMLRHTWVHAMKKANVQPDEIQEAAGWNSPAMLSRYARSTAGERAVESMRRVSPADQLRKGRKR